jgi:hypothetical protein
MHVERSPHVDAVAETFCEDSREVGEVASKVAVGPAAAIFESLRKIPMIDGAEGTNARFEQRVGQATVIIEALLIDCAGAGWLNARPGSREAIALLVQAL